jgi:VanZ family protein
MSDEWHQSFVEGRTTDVFDWLADTLGASMALVGLTLFFSKQRRQKADEHTDSPPA